MLDLFTKYEEEPRCKKLIKKAQTLYLMHSFKITCLSSQEADNFYDRLAEKYTIYSSV